MHNIELAELSTFVAVSIHRSFTKAAAHLGISAPTASQTIHALEEKLGVRLLNRTTRSVALTEAGERLLTNVLPALDGVQKAVAGMNAFRDKPMGLLRITISRSAVALIGPVIPAFLTAYPDIQLDLSVDDIDDDIVAHKFDAGVRMGERIAKDMIAVRLGGELRLVTAASPAYLKRHPEPKMPNDLENHNCIQFRHPWDDFIHRWRFVRDDEEVWPRVKGSLIVNDLDFAVRAALQGAGVVYVDENRVTTLIEERRLVPLLADWSPRLSGIFIYYSSRHHMPPALQAFVDFARVQTKLFVASKGGLRQALRLPLWTTGLRSSKNLKQKAGSVLEPAFAFKETGWT
jgi:DNA-binding transcriptional LysR family regulator